MTEPQTEVEDDMPRSQQEISFIMTYRDTINYEIKMLDYCYRQFCSLDVLSKSAELFKCTDCKAQWNLVIEGFLLHYRSLIEFFKSNKSCSNKPRPDDLKITDFKQEVTEENLKAIQEYADTLHNKYCSEGTEYSISKHLHHCTKKRSKHPNWPIEDMRKEMACLIRRFQESFPQ